jgi:hypothetical protein
MRHWCDCGFHARTLNTLRAHARACSHAYAKLRAIEDRARVDRIQRAKKINDETHEDSWRQLLEKP